MPVAGMEDWEFMGDYKLDQVENTVRDFILHDPLGLYETKIIAEMNIASLYVRKK